MWPQEYNENHPDNSANYCEMCGADLSGGEPDRPSSSRSAEALLAIANLYVDDPVASGALLRKIVNPHLSLSEIASKEGYDKSHISRKLTAVAQKYPDLSRIVGLKSRASTSQLQRRNKGPRSDYRGVTWVSSRQMWQAQIVVAGKTLFCGRFDTEIDAAKAYNDTAKRLLKSKAVLNPIT